MQYKQSQNQSQKGFAHPVALVSLVVVFSIIGFAGYRVVGNNQADSNLNNATEASGIIELTPASLEGVLPVERARELAVEKSQSSVVDLELGTEQGILVYKIDLSDGTRVLLNAKTGAKVTPSSKDVATEDNDDADEISLPDNFALGISLGRAHEIAQAKFPAGKIQKIELDVENGVVVFSARFADNARVDIDAENGDIVRTKDEQTTKTTGTSSSSKQPGVTGSSNSGRNEVRVEGLLTAENGSLTITQDGTTYVIQTSKDISSWVGKKVRAEGALQSGNVIAVEKVELR